MSLEGLVRLLGAALQEAGIPFMLTGSVAAGYRGASRATMDVDAVIDPSPAQLHTFVQRVLDAGLYVSDDAARVALTTRGMFNVIDPDSGWKADLIVRKDRSFSEEEFARRESVDFLGITLSVATLEDVVLSKLEWATLGASSRQLEDVRALLRINHGAVVLLGDALCTAAVGPQPAQPAASALPAPQHLQKRGAVTLEFGLTDTRHLQQLT